MVNKDIIDYIKSQLQKGHDKKSIKNALVSAGWKTDDITEAFKMIEQNIPVAPSYAGADDSSVSSGASLPGVGALLSEAWGIYRPRIKTFGGIIAIQIMAVAAIFIVLLVLLYGLGSGFLASSALAVTRLGGDSGLMPRTDSSTVLMNTINWLTGFAIIFLVIIVPIVMAQVWSQAAMIYAIKDSAENISAQEAYRRSWRKIGSLFWVGFLSFIIIAGGFIFFGIPGIIFSVWFSLASYIVIVENIRGMNALLKSREYVRGRAWEVFGLFLVIFLIGGALSFGAQIGLWILSMIFTIFGMAFIGIILSLSVWVILMLFTPFMITYSFLIYKHLREIKGDVVFDSSTGKKLGYLAVGVLGLLLGAGIFILPLLFLTYASRSMY